jgi:hypothetical protein
MDFNFLASANRITSTYLSQEAVNKAPSVPVLDEETKKQFGEAFEEAYDSLMATKAVKETMSGNSFLQSQNDLREHASRLGYSIDNRVIDMLHIKLSDDMNAKVNSAINSTLNSVL